MEIATQTPPQGGSTYRWYVGFLPSRNHHVWRLLGGNHCMAFRPIAGGRWVLVESNVWGLEVRTLAADEAGRLIELCINDGTLLLSLPRPRPRRTLPAPLLTCASAIASLCGIPGTIVSPRRLRKALQKHGARVVLLSGETLPGEPA